MNDIAQHQPDHYAEKIRALHRENVANSRKTVTNVIEIGQTLTEVKPRCGHGNWLHWLKTEFDWSADTAENYMRVNALSIKNRNIRNLDLKKMFEQSDEDDAEAFTEAVSRVMTAIATPSNDE
jgi:hypothetical protein